ncbi:glycosyltransferase family 2 protein [Acinetobacter sp. ANC 4173]|uniref:glycosyltransferase family 2 protein n=1 Tax=Acinetobacter sp. ANC 4173 TaxID=2529837 RepID=UPI00103E4759|nr:glycosyltransferase [Acinetobacter sp. ANC 4173]TCB80446.1 glycosyltransferase [Acinetobacter sp. ANC 4173]
MLQPKVTIVIPVYNTQDFIDQCLSSVVNQTFSNIKIIIVNDGSTDNSLKICKKFADEDKRITLVNKINEGVSVARNIGINLAEGEWIYFLDSDDYLDKNTIEYLLKEAAVSDVDIIQFGVRSYIDLKIIGERKPKNKKIYDNLHEFLLENELKPVSAWLHFFSLKKIKENKILFNTNLKHGEDMLFVYSVYCHACKILVLNKVFYNQMLSPNSTSRKPIQIKVLFDTMLFISELTDYVKENNLTNCYCLELKSLSKRIFVIPLLLESKTEFYENKKSIQILYNSIYDNNKLIFNNIYHKIARVDIGLIVFLLKIFHKIRGVKYA